LLKPKISQVYLQNSSQTHATDSVEIFDASSFKAGSYLGCGDDGSDRMTVTHWLA